MTGAPKRQNSDRPRVALIVETSINYGRGILRGISQYLRKNGSWSVFLEQRELGAALPTWIDRWDGDGLITRSDDPRILETGIPTVALFDRTAEGLGLARILNDSLAVGRLAAQHLLDRGFRSFAYYGVAGEYWSLRRWQGAREAVKEAGAEIASLEVRTGAKASADWERQQTDLARQIGALPRPLGLIACNDIHGLRALDACRRARLAAPEEVAVIGADNDAELCELADPPLSSIAFNPEKVGYEAAALLDRLMAGEAPAAEPLVISPIGVVTRQSTDILAINDPHLAQAIHFIRRHACAGINVQSVLAAAPISRRSLEQRFQRLLGRSPKEEIRRVQIDRAKVLLSETDLPVAAICRQTGFSQPAYFSVAFKQETGMTPTAFRRQATAS